MIIAEIGSAEVSGGLLSQCPSSQLTLFCDFDGPIVDVSNRYYHTYKLGLAEVKAAYQQQGVLLPLHCLSKAQFWQMKQERTPDPEIALRSGLQGEQIDQFLERVKYIVNQPHLLDQDQMQPGVRWALALLHSQGVQLVLVTLRQYAQATQMLRDYGVERLFSGIWGATDDQAAYFNQAEHKTRLLHQAVACHAHTAAWMVGDTEADILAGQAMGLPTIGLTCGIRSRVYLQKFRPTRIHADLLSAAHYLTTCIKAA
jgi:phosphoglycolate phosphatase